MTTGIVTPRRASSYGSKSLFIQFQKPACKRIKHLVCALTMFVAPAEPECVVQSWTSSSISTEEQEIKSLKIVLLEFREFPLDAADWRQMAAMLDAGYPRCCDQVSPVRWFVSFRDRRKMFGVPPLLEPIF